MHLGENVLEKGYKGISYRMLKQTLLAGNKRFDLSFIIYPCCRPRLCYLPVKY